MNDQDRQPRRKCDMCDQWSRELVEVKSEMGASFPYYVHAHEVEQCKANVKAARAQMKADKAANVAQYGQRYHH